MREVASKILRNSGSLVPIERVRISRSRSRLRHIPPSRKLWPHLLISSGVPGVGGHVEGKAAQFQEPETPFWRDFAGEG
jgi:hypothetical protein